MSRRNGGRCSSCDRLGLRKGCLGLTQQDSVFGRGGKVKDLGLMRSSSQGMCLALRDSWHLILLNNE